MCRTSGYTKDTALVDGSACISPEKLGREFLDYILRDGWIDIAGQCANTINVRIDIYCITTMGPVGCKVRWSGICMVNGTLGMVDE